MVSVNRRLPPHFQSVGSGGAGEPPSSTRRRSALLSSVRQERVGLRQQSAGPAPAAGGISDHNAHAEDMQTLLACCRRVSQLR